MTKLLRWLKFKHRSLIRIILLNILLSLCVLFVFQSIDQLDETEFADYQRRIDIENDSVMSLIQEELISSENLNLIDLSAQNILPDVVDVIRNYFNQKYEVNLQDLNIAESVRTVQIHIKDLAGKSDSFEPLEIKIIYIEKESLPINDPDIYYLMYNNEIDTSIFNTLGLTYLSKIESEQVITFLGDVSGIIDSNSLLVNEGTNLSAIVSDILSIDIIKSGNLQFQVNDYMQFDYGHNFPWSQIRATYDFGNAPTSFVFNIDQISILLLNEHEIYIHNFNSDLQNRELRQFFILLPLIPIVLSQLYLSSNFYINFKKDDEFLKLGKLMENNFIRYGVESIITHSSAFLLIVYGVVSSSEFRWILIIYPIIVVGHLLTLFQGRKEVELNTIWFIGLVSVIFGLTLGLILSEIINLNERLISMIVILMFVCIALIVSILILRAVIKLNIFQSRIPMINLVVSSKALISLIIVLLVVNVSILGNWNQEEISRSSQIMENGQPCVSDSQCVILSSFEAIIDGVNVELISTDIVLYSRILKNLEIDGFSQSINTNVLKQSESIYMSNSISANLNWLPGLLRQSNITISNESRSLQLRLISIFPYLAGLPLLNNWVLTDVSTISFFNLSGPVRVFEFGNDPNLIKKQIFSFWTIDGERIHSGAYKVILSLIFSVSAIVISLVLIYQIEYFRSLFLHISLIEKTHHSSNSKFETIAYFTNLSIFFCTILASLVSAYVVTIIELDFHNFKLKIRQIDNPILYEYLNLGMLFLFEFSLIIMLFTIIMIIYVRGKNYDQ